MAAPTGSIFRTHSDTIEEIINRSIGVLLPQLDYIWANNIVTSQNVGSADEIGRDFKILKAYQGSYAGVIEPGGPTDDFTLYGDPQNTQLGSRVFTQGLSNTWPSAKGGANARRVRLGIPMRSMLTNLMWTIGELQLEALGSFIGEAIAPKLQGHAQYLSHMLCNYWYLSQNSYYSLHTLPADTSATLTYEQSTGAGNYDTMIIDTKDSNYAIDRLWIGMRLNFYDSTGATQARSASGETVFIVTYIDELTGIYKVMAADKSALASGAAGTAGTITDGTNTFGGSATFDAGIVVFARSKGTATTPFAQSPYFTGIAGINSWLKDGTGGNNNYLLGAERDTSNAIDITKDMGEFKSMKFSLGSTPLTEHVLRGILRRFYVARRKYNGHKLDCLVASDGVWLAYEEQRIGRERTDRTSRRASLTQQGLRGETDMGLFEIECDGEILKGYTSSFIESGTVYGLKKGGGNWKRYVPPDPKGAKRNDRSPAHVPFRFAGSIVNNGQIALPIQAVGDDGTTLMTEGVQTPGMLRMQLVPENPSMLKITNVSEYRVYADES